MGVSSNAPKIPRKIIRDRIMRNNKIAAESNRLLGSIALGGDLIFIMKKMRGNLYFSFCVSFR